MKAASSPRFRHSRGGGVLPLSAKALADLLELPMYFLFGLCNTYVYIGIYICIYIYIYIYMCTYTCMYVCMYVCMYACMHACLYACMYVCLSACRSVSMYMYVSILHIPLTTTQRNYVEKVQVRE